MGIFSGIAVFGILLSPSGDGSDMAAILYAVGVVILAVQYIALDKKAK